MFEFVKNLNLHKKGGTTRYSSTLFKMLKNLTFFILSGMLGIYFGNFKTDLDMADVTITSSISNTPKINTLPHFAAIYSTL